jgi:hypothetical protein
MDTPSDARDILLALHHENSGQARHHEQQRQWIAGLVAVGAAIVLGGIAGAGPGGRGAGHLLSGILLTALGTFGFLASLHHHERSRLHVERVHVVRRELSRLFAVNVLELYAAANAEHARRFAWLSERTARVHWLWQGLHGTVLASGLALVATALCAGGP